MGLSTGSGRSFRGWALEWLVMLLSLKGGYRWAWGWV